MNLVQSSNSDLLLIARGVAALAVVFWHTGGYSGEYPIYLNIPGRTAVWLFFGISGYVIAFGFIHLRYQISLSNIKNFYINRFLRIYPLFLFLTIFTWAIELVATGKNPIPIDEIPAQLFAFQFNQNYYLNGVFWTLGIELHFYLLAPFLIIPFLSKKRFWYHWFPLFFYIALIIWIVFSYLYLDWSLDGRNIISCLPHFLTGMIGCLITKTMSKSNRRFWFSLLAMLALLIITNYIYHYSPKYYWTPIGIILVDGVILLLIIAHSSWSGTKSFAINTIAGIGLLSYGIYAWHGFWMSAPPKIAIEEVFLLLPVSIICALTTYILIEKPALKLKRTTGNLP